jgi:carbonic anhydrase
MKTIRELLLSNKAWSQEMRERSPDYFTRQTAGQKPEVLWIGCSDSRVSPEQITQTRPGELFIHRNIANIVHPEDENFLSVLQFALEELQVPHIVLCGHYGCGGIEATLKGGTRGPINNWLAGARDVQDAHLAELEAIGDFALRANRMVELNVRDQLVRLGGLDIVQRAFARGQELTLHGWVYDLRDGLLSELYEIASQEELDDLTLPGKVISLETMRSAATG